jgi:hypothetical protein
VQALADCTELWQACLGLPNLQLIAAKYPRDRDSNIGRGHDRESSMPKRVISCVPAVSVGLLATAITLGTDYTTLAANDCPAGPNRSSAQRGHWYYRVDHVNNRKCWYLAEPQARTPAAEAPQPQPSPDAPPPPTLSTFFSSLTSGFTGATAGTQPVTAAGDARTMQTAHPDNLKNDEIAPGRRPRMARRPNSEAALAPKQHRPAHARPPAEHADERPASSSSLNQAERDDLFQDFLRWKDRQTP